MKSVRTAKAASSSSRTTRTLSRRRSAAPHPLSRGHLLTELANPQTRRLDVLPLGKAFDLMNAEDRRVPAAVARAKRDIVRCIKLVSAAWRKGGRLIYIGAGTSGRLGVLDAAECPPTFRSDPAMVRGVIAGGRKALWRSIEGAEDDPAAARGELRKLKVGHRDVVMGIATGGTTPYVHAALAEARRRGAATVFFACVPRSQVKAQCDVDIRVLTGPEVLTGSTRLKAGTATKLVLNMITTLSMVRIGKTFGNLMVDLNTYACRKLVDRAVRVVVEATGLDYGEASRRLHDARGEAKTAIVAHYARCSPREARRMLDRHGNRIAAVLGTPRGPLRPGRRDGQCRNER